MITSVNLLRFGTCQIINELSIPDTDSPTGHFLYGDSISFTNRSNTIQIKRGVSFGIEYLLEGTDEENAETFEVTIVHPILIHPDTGNTYTEVIETKHSCIGDTCFDYFKVEYIWERKPGKWTFRIVQANRLLLEKVFTVYI